MEGRTSGNGGDELLSYKGVKFYKTGIAHVPVHFPNGEVTCFNCKYMYRDSAGRDKCELTGELIPFSHTERGQQCPITFEEVTE